MVLSGCRETAVWVAVFVALQATVDCNTLEHAPQSSVFEVEGFAMESDSLVRVNATTAAPTTADCFQAIQLHGGLISAGHLVTTGPSAGECYGVPFIRAGGARFVIKADSTATLVTEQKSAGKRHESATTVAGMDLEGEDLQDPGVMPVADPATCLRLCAFHAVCNAATYNHVWRQCWLKSKTDEHPVNPTPCTPSTGICQPATSYYLAEAPRQSSA